MAIDREAPLLFLRTAFHPDDWVAVLLKSHDTGGTAQRVGPLSLIAHPRFQAWLRAQSARRFSVFVSINAIRPQRKVRTRDAVGEIRHVFLDVDRNGEEVLAAIKSRGDLPPPSYVVQSSPNRLHVLWQASGFGREAVEALQKQLARELGADKSATSCAQTTRLPGFPNHKYRPGPLVTARYLSRLARRYTPSDFPTVTDGAAIDRPNAVTAIASGANVLDRARRYVAEIPPATAGQHGDVDTFRVCCRLVRGFSLDDDSALAILSEWNLRCQPPWSEKDLRAKLQSARHYGREAIGGLLRAR